jgi:O-antigen/teichoic acid export membrane protein
MGAVVTPSADGTAPTLQRATRTQIRGSSMLMVGRLLTLGLNFAIQVLIVRYLSKSDYGAFAYALSVVAIGEAVATFGLDRAVTRFVPIYHERADYDKLFGTLALVLGAVAALGVLVIGAVYAAQLVLGLSFIDDQLAASLVLILIFLAPLGAFDAVVLGLFAVFASPRAIFFRKYIVAPALKLLVVALFMIGGSNVLVLAGGYLVAAVLAMAFFVVLLARVMRQEGLFAHLHAATIQLPAHEVLAFTLPLLSSDLVYLVMGSLDGVLLGHYHGATDVATLRAVQPAAKLNQLVLTTFGLLFTPAAARMFARDDRAGINDLYWRNAAWIAVMSFPVFALSFSLAQPFTLLVYGDRYQQSAAILALLSLGYYFNAALGQNGLTLKVFGKVRAILIINLLVVALSVALNLLLIPPFGPLGAAVGTCLTLILFNLLKQAGLRWGTGISLLDRRYARTYLVILLCAAALLVFELVLDAPIYLDFGLAAGASLLVLRLNRRLLAIEQTFPELLRIPLLRRLLGP